MNLSRTLLAIALLASVLHAQKTPQNTSQRSAAIPDPAFEVATVKPSDPNETDWGTTISGRHFQTYTTNMNDLISYAYGVHAKQIVNGPAWFAVDKFDIDGLPPGTDKPSRDQYHAMVRKLLAERFKLTCHQDKKELTVYSITLAKDGPRLTPSASEPDGPSSFGFGPLGTLTIKNMTIEAIAGVMQRVILDKPVIDRTGLKGRYDVLLQWRIDETQFAQLRNTGIPAPPDDPNGPPSLNTAIQQQLGLRLDTVKAPVDVLVIDHAEHPSEN